MKKLLLSAFLAGIFLTAVFSQSEVLIADFESSIPNTYYYAPGGTAQIVDNPFMDAANPSAKVLKFKKGYGQYKLIGFGFPDLGIRVKQVKEVQFLLRSDNFRSLYVSTENNNPYRTSEIIYSADGKLIREFALGKMQKGYHQVPVNVKNISLLQGQYLCAVDVSPSKANRKLAWLIIQ